MLRPDRAACSVAGVGPTMRTVADRRSAPVTARPTGTGILASAPSWPCHERGAINPSPELRGPSGRWNGGELLTAGSRCAAPGVTGTKPRGAMGGIFKGQFLWRRISGGAGVSGAFAAISRETRRRAGAFAVLHGVAEKYFPFRRGRFAKACGCKAGRGTVNPELPWGTGDCLSRRISGGFCWATGGKWHETLMRFERGRGGGRNSCVP